MDPDPQENRHMIFRTALHIDQNWKYPEKSGIFIVTVVVLKSLARFLSYKILDWSDSFLTNTVPVGSTY